MIAEWTSPTLMAGMWNLLAIIDTLEHYSLAELEKMGALLFETLGGLALISLCGYQSCAIAAL